MALVILAGALLFSLVVRWRLREFPLERDEGGYAYIGQRLLAGVPPMKTLTTIRCRGSFWLTPR